jgi:hypothetical protein
MNACAQRLLGSWLWALLACLAMNVLASVGEAEPPGSGSTAPKESAQQELQAMAGKLA